MNVSIQNYFIDFSTHAQTLTLTKERHTFLRLGYCVPIYICAVYHIQAPNNNNHKSHWNERKKYVRCDSVVKKKR